MLSVCIIARNAQASLERALTSVQGLADEVILTDTGSTDSTIEIARAHNARVIFFPWCDDFAAAYNYGFDQARGDWIFWLDADEELLPSSKSLMAECLRCSEVLAYLIVRQDVLDTSRPDRYSEMVLPRLFRNLPELRLVGRHHPHVPHSLEELARQRGQTVELSDIRMRHDGYAGPLRREKFHRDVRLLELELQDRPDQLYYQIELYRTLLLLEEARWFEVFLKALEALRGSTRDPRPPMPTVSLLLETLLQIPEARLPDGFDHRLAMALARRWFPRSAPLMWFFAKRSYEAGRFAEAEKQLRQLLQMGQDHSYDRMVGFDPRILHEEAEINLAVCLIRQGKLRQAQTMLEALQQHPEYRQIAQQNLRAIQQISDAKICGPRQKR